MPASLHIDKITSKQINKSTASRTTAALTTNPIYYTELGQAESWRLIRSASGSLDLLTSDVVNIAYQFVGRVGTMGSLLILFSWGNKVGCRRPSMTGFIVPTPTIPIAPEFPHHFWHGHTEQGDQQTGGGPHKLTGHAVFAGVMKTWTNT